jgi:replicative DNA helicase
MVNPTDRLPEHDPVDPLRPEDAVVESIAVALVQDTFQSSTDALLARLHARHAGRETPIPLPWPSLGKALGGGLWPGLHFVVGATGGGKSQFALQAALHAARHHVPVLYVALELAPLDLCARALGILDPRQPWSALYLGHRPVPQDPPPGAVLPAVEQLRRLPVHWAVGTPHGWSHALLAPHAAALRTLYPRAPTMLLVLDFAQLLTGPEREVRERIGAAAYAARAVARDYHAAVLMLSSVAREHYAALVGDARRAPGKVVPPDGTARGERDTPLGRGPAARFVGLGKESGDTEYAADSVLVLTQEPWPDAGPPEGGTRVHLAVAKWRAGPTSWVPLRFNGSVFTEPPSHDAPRDEVSMPPDEPDEGGTLPC